MSKNNSNFVHLNCHSEYSIVDGILRIKPFIEQIVALGMKSVALTDQSNLFGMVKFYKAAIALKIKPIIGADVWLDNSEQRLTLLCQNNQGLQNLMQLVSKSYSNWHNNKPIVNKDWLLQTDLHTGLIAIAPMIDSDIGRALTKNNLQLATECTNQWFKLFNDRFYLAVTRVLNNKVEENILQQILTIAAENIPIVVTNEVRFLEKEDFIAHEARVCINQGVRLDDSNRVKNYNEEQYLKSSKEIEEIFTDLPEGLINAVEISKRCNVKLTLGKSYLPKYNTPNNISEQQYLVEAAESGLITRLNCNSIKDLPVEYSKRLQEEISVINNMGFAGYFLIVADIIQWSLQQKIPIGPGRGSGAGSLVAFALYITNIDPLKYDLLFERFLNPERVSMPDFDIDFCINGRDVVINYVVNKYGKESVAQIITYGTMAAKAAIRDIGRVLGSPYGFVDQIAKLIPLELGMTINKALEQEEILKQKYVEDEEVKAIIDLAKKIEGITRNVGRHAGGLVIAPTDIVKFSPVFCEENGVLPVTQFDKNDIEDIGLVKFDFLGLKNLTVIDEAVKAININKANDQLVNIDKITINDPKTMELLCSGNTTAIFQLESRGMRELTVKLQPNCFEDLIAIGALYRPGPLQSGMVDDFIDRKRGVKPIEYPHPKLAYVLQSTYGVIVYQEQVMQIAQILAGYTLGSADLLRRAMGKKKSEEMAKQRAIFIEGSSERGVDPEQANNIFDIMEKFSKYGFPKPHATAYALITYQTAWLKTYYPAEFMASVISLELDNTDKIILFIIDCRKNGITITAPNINTSVYKFVATSSNQISYGLGAIKGIGELAVNNIVLARKSGAFKDLFDLCKRVDLHKVSRKTLEALIKSGALDCFNLNRASLLNVLEPVLKAVSKLSIGAKKQLSLFDEFALEDFNIRFAGSLCQEWEPEQLLITEKEAFGFYFSRHPLTAFEKELISFGVSKFAEANINYKSQRFAGLIVFIRSLYTKKGDKMAFITLDDGFSRQEIVVFSDLYNENKELLKKDCLIIIEGEVSKDNYTGGFKIKCNKIMDLYGVRKKNAKNLTIVLQENLNNNFNAQKLKQIIETYPGDCPLTICYKNSGKLIKIKSNANLGIDPKEQLLTDLKTLPEIEDVIID